jgi:hypothetical protein
MNPQEHIVAVVDSTHEEDSTLDLARQVVDRGGRATVVVLVNGTTTNDIRRFAEAENLTFPDAHEIYLERLSRIYSSRVGGLDTSAIIAEGDYSGRSVFASAEKAGPTTIAVPQSLAHRPSWRGPVAHSRVPVLIAPHAGPSRQTGRKPKRAA